MTWLEYCCCRGNTQGEHPSSRPVQQGVPQGGREAQGTTGPASSSPTVSESAALRPTDAPVMGTQAPSTPSPVTAEPTTVPKRTYIVPSVMTLKGSKELDRDAVEVWVQETEDRIRNEAEEIVTEDGEGLEVTVQLLSQQSQVLGRRALPDSAIDGRIPSEMVGGISGETLGRYLRRLQSDPIVATRLQIVFTTTIEFISDEDDWNPNKMVAAGFESLKQQDEYLYALKAADSTSFRTVRGMALEVEGMLVTETEVPSNLNLVRDGSIYYIIGGTLGGALLMLAVMAIFYKRKPSPSAPSVSPPPKSLPQDAPLGTLTVPSGDALRPPAATAAASVNMPPSQNYFGTIESREGEDDVSTLGEPYFGEGAVQNPEPRADATVAESMISSEQRMFEYGVGRERLNSAGDHPSTVSPGGTAGPSGGPNIFGDDATYEAGYRTPDGSYEDNAAVERLVVTAPGGKLGIVVDNQTGDMPIVHAIKEDSALHGEVRVGDILVSVDEVDCRGMSAVQVSRLISSRMNNPARSLVLLRDSGGSC